MVCDRGFWRRCVVETEVGMEVEADKLMTESVARGRKTAHKEEKGVMWAW